MNLNRKGISLLEIASIIGILIVMVVGISIIFDANSKNNEVRAHLKTAQIMAIAAEELVLEKALEPKKGKDFEILFNELEAWRLNETKKVKNSNELNEEEKKLAL